MTGDHYAMPRLALRGELDASDGAAPVVVPRAWDRGLPKGSGDCYGWRAGGRRNAFHDGFRIGIGNRSSAPRRSDRAIAATAGDCQNDLNAVRLGEGGDEARLSSRFRFPC
jgi:hypothetical protein